MKPRKTKTIKLGKAAVSSAVIHIEWSHSPLFALQEFGQKGARAVSALGMFGAYQAVTALCQQARDSFCGAIDATTPHPAAQHLGEAFDSLKMLEQFMDMADSSSEGARNKHSADFCRLVGDVIGFYASQAGKSMERAEIALGQQPTCGFLDNEKQSSEQQKQTQGEGQLVGAQ